MSVGCVLSLCESGHNVGGQIFAGNVAVWEPLLHIPDVQKQLSVMEGKVICDS